MRYPVLLPTGARDMYDSCCFVETMQQFDAAAQRLGAPIQTVVYSQAEHGFNLPVPLDRAAGAADATSRLIELLARR